MAAQSPVPGNDIASTLPEELAWAILDCLPLRPALVRVSHVSHRWRELARTHSSFWRCVKLHDSGFSSCSHEYDLMRAQLEASEMKSLDISIDVDREASGWVEPGSENDPNNQRDGHPYEGRHTAIPMNHLLDLAVLLKKHVHRIVRLRLNLSLMVLGHLIASRFFDTPASLLQELELAAHTNRSVRSRPFDWSCIRHAPKLRMLRLQVDLVAESPGRSRSCSHSALEELSWEPAVNGDTQVPPVEELLGLLPQLRCLDIRPRLHLQDFKDPAAASMRLAGFDKLGLPRGILNLLDAAQLARVLYLFVPDPDLSTIRKVVYQFLVDNESARRQYSVSNQALDIQLWPLDDNSWWQPMTITEISPRGQRIRAFDMGEYIRRRLKLPQMVCIADRVTKLAVSLKEWDILVEALCGAPALQELVIRVLNSRNRAYIRDQQLFLQSTQPKTLQSQHLGRVILQASQRRHAPASSVDLVARDFATFIERVIDSGVWRKMDLIIEGVNWVEDVDNGKLEELMAPFFSNVQIEESGPSSSSYAPLDSTGCFA